MKKPTLLSVLLALMSLAFVQNATAQDCLFYIDNQDYCDYEVEFTYYDGSNLRPFPSQYAFANDNTEFTIPNCVSVESLVVFDPNGPNNAAVGPLPGFFTWPVGACDFGSTADVNWLSSDSAEIVP